MSTSEFDPRQVQARLPERRDWRIGVVGSGFVVNDCHLVAYRRAGFNFGRPSRPSRPTSR